MIRCVRRLPLPTTTGESAMGRKKEIDRDRILDAVDAVIVEGGGRSLTLDAVAERAGISKGGLVYSFATKDELIAASLAREMDRVQAAVRRRAGGLGDDASAQLIAILDEALSENEAFVRRASFLMTAVVHNPELSQPARSFYRSLLDLFDPDAPGGRDVRQAFLAVEGLFLLRGLGLVEIDHREWTSVLAHARDTVAAALSAERKNG